MTEDNNKDEGARKRMPWESSTSMMDNDELVEHATGLIVWNRVKSTEDLYNFDPALYKLLKKRNLLGTLELSRKRMPWESSTRMSDDEGVSFGRELAEAEMEEDIERFAMVGLSGVADFAMGLGEVDCYVAPEVLGKILDKCKSQEEVAAFEAEFDKGVQNLVGDHELAEEHVSRLREKIAEKKDALGAKMGGTLSKGTVKPPARKEAPKKPGPLKRKR